MPRPQAVPAESPSQRETQLRLAEQEIAAAEAQLYQEVARLEASSGELLGRLQHVKAAASQAQLSGVRTPGFAELHQRVHQTQVGRLDATSYVNAALNARAQAVEARKEHAEQLREAVSSFASELSRLASQLTADEAAMTRFEASAREESTRREAKTISEPMPVPRPPPSPKPASAQVPHPQGRRAQPRVRMQAAVDLHSESNLFTGFSTNISEGGLFVATVQQVPIGTEIDLGFTLPGGHKMSVKGVVRWTREVNDQTPEIFPGVGIQFVDLDPQTEATLQKFVSAREPMFFPE